jgi:ABC-type uncharacterized transport system substrate-binding protein
MPVIGLLDRPTSTVKLVTPVTVRHAMPAVYQYREFAAAGGLMSYGGGLEDSCRLAGIYTGRVLEGEKPADLPVQQSTKVELFINQSRSAFEYLDADDVALAASSGGIDKGTGNR